MTGSIEVDQKAVGGTLYAGWDLNESFAAEVAWTHLGRWDGNARIDQVLDLDLKVSAWTIGAYGLFKLPMASGTPFLRAGLHRWDGEGETSWKILLAEVESDSASGSDNGVSWAVGGGWKSAGDRVRLRVDYMYYDVDDMQVHYMGLGAEMPF